MLNDKYAFQLLIGGTIIVLSFAFALFAFLLVQKRKQNIYHSERQILLNSQNYLLRTVLEEREKTMNDISYEIHEDVSQLLSLAQNQIKTVLLECVNDSRHQNLLRKADSVLTGIGEQLHHMSHSLNSDYVKKRGLINVLTEELEYITTTRKLACNIDLIGKYRRASFEIELLIYRIAMGAIHNTIKHAKATTLDILFTYEEHAIIMFIKDNGVGFTKDEEEAGGIGFINMTRAAECLHANLSIKSGPNEGCCVKLTVNNLIVDNNVFLHEPGIEKLSSTTYELQVKN